MSLYFDYKVNTKYDVDVTNVQWHLQQPLLAVASHSLHTASCYVNLYDELGEALNTVNELCEANNQVTCLSWHPTQRMLIVGFLTGDLRIWNNQSDFTTMPSPHSVPILHLTWSRLGSRLVSSDQNGNMAAWKMNNRGLLTRIFNCQMDGRPLAIEFGCAKAGIDLTAYAKKAIDGDEKALDMFSAWRPRTGGLRPTVHTDVVSFYAAAYSAKVYHVTENGEQSVVLKCEREIKHLMHHPDKNILLVILDGMSVCRYTSNADGSLSIVTTVKLSGIDEKCMFTWAGCSLLTCATVDCNVRFWDVENEDSYLIDSGLAPISAGKRRSLLVLSYSESRGLLCGGTSEGDIIFWRKKKGEERTTEDSWERAALCKMSNPVLDSNWGSTYLAVLTKDGAYILQEHSLTAHYNKMGTCLQTAANRIVIYRGDKMIELSTDLKVIGVASSADYVAVWSGKTVAIYEITTSDMLNVAGSFSYECEHAAIYERNLVVSPNCSRQPSTKIQVRTFQGTVKQYLDCDGQPILLHLNGCYLTVATITGMLHVWNVSRREAKIHAHPKDLTEVVSNFGEVMSCGVNCNGSKVSFTVANSSLFPDPTLYIWDVENDNIISYRKSGVDSPEWYVISHCWDLSEPTLLACELKPLAISDNTAKKLNRPMSGVKKGAAENFQPDLTFSPQFAKNEYLRTSATTCVLQAIFVSNERGPVVHDTMTLQDGEHVSLLAIDAPYYITLAKSAEDAIVKMKKLSLSNFEELSEVDEDVKSAVLKFSFHLCIGDVDSAFKSIVTVTGSSVWRTLAKMCVKKKRLEVAQLCLGNMKDARGVATMRTIIAQEKDPRAHLPALAIHLGMLDEAESLYIEAGRYDLLNRMYQCSNRWDAALAIAKKQDRVCLQNTYHAFGNYLEKKGKIDEAIEMYTRAGNHRTHVPRLLLQKPAALQRYIDKSKDPCLIKWWAQYMESVGNMEMALRYYEQAKDDLSIVRILCFLENVEKATAVANSSNNPAACYHLARYYENQGQVENAVHFFAKSKAYNNAIRLCKDHRLDEEMWTLALNAGPREQIEAARYFEGNDPYKAVMLYQKAGNVHRAVALAFKHEMTDAMRLISNNLTSNLDVELIEKCATFFLKHGDYENAVNLLASANKLEEAVSLCGKYHVKITEELAELLTPTLEHPDRLNILKQIAEYSMLQGSYHLATKKYTQAGDKVNAMKALLKSGDTEKVIFFANVSRDRDIYILAANYLQTLDWHTDPQLLKHIVNFYSKGKAPHLLANFYVSCAQAEVDEYGNYEKCLEALSEASRCLNKHREEYGQILEGISRKIAYVKQFLEIRRQLEETGNEESLSMCRKLLSSVCEPLRKGDIFALMIEHTARSNDVETAIALVSEMKKMLPLENIAYYISKDVLEKIGFTVEEKNAEVSEDGIIEEVAT